MNKAYFFAMFLLVASFTGCLGSDELEQMTTEDETDEDETVTPVGNETNHDPYVDFIDVVHDYGHSYLTVAIYDLDGYVLSYNIESSNQGYLTGSGKCYNGIIFNGSESNSIYDCIPFGNTIIINMCYDLEHVNQTITVEIKDNDGNEASADYDLIEDEFECEGMDNMPDSEGAPIATFFVQESSSGVYHVEVIMVSWQANLTDFSYFLKDETGSTHVGGNGFGEIAMQIIGGQEHGIDTSYSDSCDNDCDSQLESRASNVSADDGTDYPVHFSDNDRDGKLSAGDQFMVYGLGNSANGPAEDNWRLEIQYDPTGDIIGSAKML